MCEKIFPVLTICLIAVVHSCLMLELLKLPIQNATGMFMERQSVLERMDENGKKNGLLNKGTDCWKQCKGKQGQCNFCGTGFCCRFGWGSKDQRIKSGCDGSVGVNGQGHVCVARPDKGYSIIDMHSCTKSFKLAETLAEAKKQCDSNEDCAFFFEDKCTKYPRINGYRYCGSSTEIVPYNFCNTLYRKETGAVYKLGSLGTHCTDERHEIKSAKKCQEAAISIGLTWSTSWEGEGDFPACFYAMDSRNVVYFNESPKPKRDPYDIYKSYAPICKATLTEKCCGLEARYPEVIPGVTWGSRTWSTEDKEEWESSGCRGLVGGEKKINCVCKWYGTSPFCDPDCPPGWRVEKTDKNGGGAYCSTGLKKLCCPN